VDKCLAKFRGAVVLGIVCWNLLHLLSAAIAHTTNYNLSVGDGGEPGRRSRGGRLGERRARKGRLARRALPAKRRYRAALAERTGRATVARACR